MQRPVKLDLIDHENNPFPSKFFHEHNDDDDDDDDEDDEINDEDEIEIVDLTETEDEKKFDNLYPNCDVNVWLRTCEYEIVMPIRGEISGEIPLWINGSLLRNGPGSVKVGDMAFSHLFDCSALLHRFDIKNGNVTYQCKFLQSDTYKKNHEANRIIVTEFGTSSVPDVCNSIFRR
jgi:carotenoid isomerooxygenase